MDTKDYKHLCEILVKSKLQWQKTDQWLPGAGVRDCGGDWWQRGTGNIWGWQKYYISGLSWWLHCCTHLSKTQWNVHLKLMNFNICKTYLNKADFLKMVLFLHENQRFRLDIRDFWSWDITEDFLSWDFPGGTVVKNLPANAGDMGSIPGPGRSHMPQSN